MSDPGARVVGAFMPWARVEAAVSLLAVDPFGLRGLWLRGRAGPVRDRVIAALDALPMPVRRVHPSVSDDVLFGGIDLTASLAAGRRVATAGLLATRPALILTMAERCGAALAVRLGQWLDQPGAGVVVALDEGIDGDEMAPAALTERLALLLDLDAIGWQETRDIRLPAARMAAARQPLP